MKRAFVIRFAKGLGTTPLYFSPLDGQLAFTPEILKAFGLKSREDAEALLADIMEQVYKVEPCIYDKLADPATGLSIEEHTFGDYLQ